jgi:hypothetical protein
MPKRCSVVRNYIEDSESSGAETQFRLQCFVSGLRHRRFCRFAGSEGVEFRFEGRKLSDLRVNFFLLGVELGLALRIFGVVGVGEEGVLVECVQAQEQVHFFLLIGNLALQSGNFGIRRSVSRFGISTCGRRSCGVSSGNRLSGRVGRLSSGGSRGVWLRSSGQIVVGDYFGGLGRGFFLFLGVASRLGNRSVLRILRCQLRGQQGGERQGERQS